MMRDKIYYLVMHRGMPVDVTMYEFNAVERAKERSIPNYPATVLAVSAIQLGMFTDEDTMPDSPPNFCTSTYCVVNSNYEVGSGKRCPNCE